MSTLKLPCKLTASEIEAKGRECGEAFQRLDAIRDEKRSVLAEFKERFKAAETAGKLAARCISTGTEEREVGVVETPDHKRGIVEITRQDTGELVSTRVLSEAERQGNLLQLVEEPADAD